MTGEGEWFPQTPSKKAALDKTDRPGIGLCASGAKEIRRINSAFFLYKKTTAAAIVFKEARYLRFRDNDLESRSVPADNQY